MAGFFAVCERGKDLEGKNTEENKTMCRVPVARFYYADNEIMYLGRRKVVTSCYFVLFHYYDRGSQTICLFFFHNPKEVCQLRYTSASALG